jgi:predicted RNA binding protein YcfA (HicA-like mRNA interferase family)
VTGVPIVFRSRTGENINNRRLRIGFVVTVREIIKTIESEGWFLSRQRGSHRQFKHPTRGGIVTVAGKPSKDLAPKTVKSIFRQAGMSQ